jgi:hypothetical protein
MATNFFFNNFTSSQEQTLLEDLIIESIKIHGVDVIYLPRSTGTVDAVFNEDITRSYVAAVPIEMYVKNVEGFAGDGDFLSKFNLEIRDQITFTVAFRTFANEVIAADTTTGDATRDRPLEGDLIYFPFNKKIFEIRFVEHESVFYQLGSLQMYDLKCELFEYNNEYFGTGVPDVDRLMYNYSLGSELYGIKTENSYLITTEDGYPLLQEEFDSNDHENDPLSQNEEIETVADGIIDFTERDPFSEGTY